VQKLLLLSSLAGLRKRDSIRNRGGSPSMSAPKEQEPAITTVPLDPRRTWVAVSAGLSWSAVSARFALGARKASAALRSAP